MKTRKLQNSKLKTSVGGARARYLATHPQERKVQKATTNKIRWLAGTFRRDTQKWQAATIKLANDARAIGLFVLEFLDALPGKRMTVDFWKQLGGMFIDQYGRNITQEQLKLFTRLAKNNREPITDLQIALSWRQTLLAAAGFVLPGKRAAGHAKTVNHYNRFFDVMSEKKLALVLTNLEADPNFGPMENWPDSRKQSVRLQIQPVMDRMLVMAGKLNN